MDTKSKNRILELRKEKNISQDFLAKQIGVSQKAIDFWEKAINEPKASFAIKLAKYFNVSVEYLMGESDNPN